MSDGEPNKETPNYTVDISKQSLIDIYAKQWVLNWCMKNHPEVFKEADKAIKKLIQEDKDENN